MTDDMVWIQLISDEWMQQFPPQSGDFFMGDKAEFGISGTVTQMSKPRHSPLWPMPFTPIAVLDNRCPQCGSTLVPVAKWNRCEGCRMRWRGGKGSIPTFSYGSLTTRS